MKNKGMLTLLVILFIIAAGCGGVGFYYSSNRVTEEKPKPVEEPVTAKISYLYYLEETKVDEMPKNDVTTAEDGTETTNVKYKFSRFSCTNDLTGSFNEDTWEFTPAEQKDSVCSLYFVNAKYNVTLTVVNGQTDGDNTKEVEREQNGKFKIIPDAGYEFKEAQCSPDDKAASWDSSDSTININAITSDVMCKVTFGIKELTAKITVVNGTGNTTEKAKYGESVSAIVSANDGYEKPKIECTNKQTATFENNKISIQKLTDNTECKITFNAVPITKYKLTFELPQQVTVVSGNLTQEIESGKDGTITLQTDSSYTHSLDCGGVSPSKSEDINATTRKYTFLAIKNNITCKVTATRIEQEPTTPTEPEQPSN